MALLLDTHALLWALEDAPELSPNARAAISTPQLDVWASAASAYELSFKAKLGRLRALPQTFASLLAAQGFRELAVTAGHAELAGRLPLVNRDPWDRILAAQALIEGLTLVTRDDGVAALGAPVLW